MGWVSKLLGYSEPEVEEAAIEPEPEEERYYLRAEVSDSNHAIILNDGNHMTWEEAIALREEVQSRGADTWFKAWVRYCEDEDGVSVRASAIEMLWIKKKP